MLVSDHPHLFETGGENYHSDFTAWDYLRGHEGDPWRTYPRPELSGAGAARLRRRLDLADAWAGRAGRPSLRPLADWFRAEADFPGPKTMRAAAAGCATARPTSASCCSSTSSTRTSRSTRPSPGPSKYDPDWEGAHLIWPPYDVGAVAAGG